MGLEDALAKYDHALKYAQNWKQLKEAREAAEIAANRTFATGRKRSTADYLARPIFELVYGELTVTYMETRYGRAFTASGRINLRDRQGARSADVIGAGSRPAQARLGRKAASSTVPIASGAT